MICVTIVGFSACKTRVKLVHNIIANENGVPERRYVQFQIVMQNRSGKTQCVQLKTTVVWYLLNATKESQTASAEKEYVILLPSSDSNNFTFNVGTIANPKYNTGTGTYTDSPTYRTDILDYHNASDEELNNKSYLKPI